MHKKLLVSACVLGFSVPVLASDWFDAGIATYDDWPSDGTDKVITEVGTWSNTAMAGLAGETDAKYLAVTNAESALTFTTADAKSLADVDATFVSDVKYTAFEEEDLPEIPAEAKAGLTVVQDAEGALTWQAIRYDANTAANVWVPLTATGVPATTSEYVTVSVKLSQTRVSYSVNGTPLADDDGVSDFNLAAAAETLSVASYQGVGEVKTLSGTYQGAPWEGAGTVDEPYLVATVADLQNMATYFAQGRYNDKVFSLEYDIDLTGEAWSGIGTAGNPFTGVFNCANHVISGIAAAPYALFAYADGAYISCLTLFDAAVIGTASGEITFSGCCVYVSKGAEPAYDYAYVLNGNAGSIVTFMATEGENYGPAMMKPVPDDVVELTDTMRYGYADGTAEANAEALGKEVEDCVWYLIGTETAEDLIINEFGYVGDTYLLLADRGNTDFAVFELWEEDESIALDTSLADFDSEPVGIIVSMEDTLYLHKSVSGKVTTYWASTEPPAPTLFTVTVPELTGGLLIKSISTNGVPVDPAVAGDYTLVEGETFTMTYEPDAGYVFVDGEDETGVREATEDATIEPPAVEAKSFSIAVSDGGSASPNAFTIKSAFPLVVALTKPTNVPEGKEFDGWSASVGNIDGDTLTIGEFPNDDVVVTAAWKDKPAEVMPESILGGSTEQQSAYLEWAKGITDAPGKTDEIYADAFALQVTQAEITAAGDLTKAVQAKIAAEITEEMLEGLVAGTGFTGEFTLEKYPNAVFRFVETDEIASVEGLSKFWRLHASFLPAD